MKARCEHHTYGMIILHCMTHNWPPYLIIWNLHHSQQSNDIDSIKRLTYSDFNAKSPQQWRMWFKDARSVVCDDDKIKIVLAREKYVNVSLSEMECHLLTLFDQHIGLVTNVFGGGCGYFLWTWACVLWADIEINFHINYILHYYNYNLKIKYYLL